MFTLYRIVQRSVAESVPDRASIHTRNAGFEAVSAPEQYCSAPLLKVERSVSDRFLKRSESSLNTFIGAEIAPEPRFDKLSFQITTERCELHSFCSHWERFGTVSAPQQNINTCSHCTGATFEMEQKPIRYSVNIAKVIKDQIQYRYQSLLNLARGYFFKSCMLLIIRDTADRLRIPHARLCKSKLIGTPFKQASLFTDKDIASVTSRTKSSKNEHGDRMRWIDDGTCESCVRLIYCHRSN